MLSFNGKKFAVNDEEFTNSLFNPGGTCTGYYRVNKKTVTIMNQRKEKIGVVTNNVLGCATKQDNGKYWYSYADIKEIGSYDSYIDQSNDIDNAMALLNTGV